MRFTVEHRFDCPPERFWELFWDPEFDRRVDEAAGTRRTVVREWREGGLRCWRSRFEASAEGESAVTAVLGRGLLDYEQESRLDEKRGELTWTVLPGPLPFGVTLSASGTMRVEPDGAGCVRRVEGEVSVGVPLVGGTIEAAVCRRVEESYERAADVLREMLAERDADR
ncbi:MAG: DUF2505 domain-containing protein [Acidobacteria bacterium]|nr:MAG: DUF2505 domain-containing protein [Acidobacteriota bacterium]